MLEPAQDISGRVSLFAITARCALTSSWNAIHLLSLGACTYQVFMWSEVQSVTLHDFLLEDSSLSAHVLQLITTSTCIRLLLMEQTIIFSECLIVFRCLSHTGYQSRECCVGTIFACSCGFTSHIVYCSRPTSTVKLSVRSVHGS